MGDAPHPSFDSIGARVWRGFVCQPFVPAFYAGRRDRLDPQQYTFAGRAQWSDG